MTATTPARAADHALRRLEDAVGGPARTRVVVLFACVLALESADLAAIGAVAPQLKSQLHVTNTQLGLLAAVSTFVGGVMTIPFGVLVDRVRRVTLLSVSVATWAAAMVVGAVAQSYGWLLLSRIGLGAVAAVAAPAIASMTGDFFAAEERGKIYGYVLSGELLGTGLGFVVSGGIGGALGWRWGFAVLALPALVLAIVLWRGLAEPARGGQSHLEPGAQSVEEAAEPAEDSNPEAQAPSQPHVDKTRRAIVSQGASAEREHILREDPDRMPLARVIRYVLSIPTYRWLIIASSIGYFFFAGIRTFGVVFMRGHFGLSQGAAIAVLFVAGLGSLAGVLISGRTADRRIRRGHVTSRIVVGGVLYLAAAAFMLPAVLVPSLIIAMPLLILGAAGLSGPNPPIDAARLDIMPGQLWGRAEGVRALLRQTAQAGAPLLFGLLADVIAGTHGNALASGSSKTISAAGAHGLTVTFAIMIVPLALNGILLLRVPRREYPDDVATAIASERAVAERVNQQERVNQEERVNRSEEEPVRSSPDDRPD